MANLSYEELIEWLQFVENHEPPFDSTVLLGLTVTGSSCRIISLLKRVSKLIKQKKYEEVVTLLFKNQSNLYKTGEL